MESILPCCLPYGKAGGLQILCCPGINVTDYNFNLDALAQKPSGFCNVGVCLTPKQVRYAQYLVGLPVAPILKNMYL